MDFLDQQKNGLKNGTGESNYPRTEEIISGKMNLYQSLSQGKSIL